MTSLQEPEVPLPREPTTQSHPDPHTIQIPIVAQFGWVEIKPTEGIELNYLDTFLKNCNGATIDYRRLEIPKSDPSPLKDSDMSFDIASIHTRLSKYGGLNMGSKKEKNKELNYDLEDSFIDDHEGNISGIQNTGMIEPVVDDFVCVRGSVQAFKASSYYQERVKTIKQSLTEVTKKKKVEPKEPKDQKPKEPKEPKKKVVKQNSGEKPKIVKQNSGEKAEKAEKAEKGEKLKEFKEPKEKKKPKEPKEPKEAKEKEVKEGSVEKPKEAKEAKEPKKKNPGANKRKRSSGSGIERPANEEKRVKETKDESPAGANNVNDENNKIIHIELNSS